jgi:hypothetical protein
MEGLSLWSEGSFLSVGSVGSFLSVGSVGSALSIGSVGSVGSAFSVGSAVSLGSVLSAAARVSVLSAGTNGAVLGERGQRLPGAVLTGALLAIAAGLIVRGTWASSSRRLQVARGRNLLHEDEDHFRSGAR